MAGAMGTSVAFAQDVTYGGDTILTGGGTDGDGAVVVEGNATVNQTRIAGDDALGVRIDGEEIARIAGDDALGVRIDGEETARIAGDDALGVRIDGEETARIAGDTALGVRIGNEETTRNALIRREADGFIHIGTNSMIYDDTQAGSDRLTSSKRQLILGGNATTDILIDANLDVAGEANFQNNINVAGDVFVNGRAQGLQSQVDANSSDIARNRKDIKRNERGIAMVAALTHTTVLPGMTNALDVSAAHFEGETGLAISYSRRLNENVQINIGAASTTDFDEGVIRGGIGYQW